MLSDDRLLRAHGAGAQLYLTDDLVDETVFPLTPGGECLVQTIPNRMVLLLPADIEPEYPLTIRDPHRFETIDPDPNTTQWP